MSRRYAGTDDMEGGAACYVLFFISLSFGSVVQDTIEFDFLSSVDSSLW